MAVAAVANLTGSKETYATRVEVCRLNKGKRAGSPYWRFHTDDGESVTCLDLKTFFMTGWIRNSQRESGHWFEFGEFELDDPIPVRLTLEKNLKGKEFWEISPRGWHYVKREVKDMNIGDRISYGPWPGTIISLGSATAGVKFDDIERERLVPADGIMPYTEGDVLPSPFQEGDAVVSYLDGNCTIDCMKRAPVITILVNKTGMKKVTEGHLLLLTDDCVLKPDQPNPINTLERRLLDSMYHSCRNYQRGGGSTYMYVHEDHPIHLSLIERGVVNVVQTGARREMRINALGCHAIAEDWAEIEPKCVVDDELRDRLSARYKNAAPAPADPPIDEAAPAADEESAPAVVDEAAPSPADPPIEEPAPTVAQMSARIHSNINEEQLTRLVNRGVQFLHMQFEHGRLHVVYVEPATVGPEQFATVDILQETVAALTNGNGGQFSW